MTRLVLLLTLIAVQAVKLFAQQPFDPSHPNLLLLEHMIHERVNEVRVSKGCEKLINDSVLYVAAHYHAGYMQRKKMLSHDETEASKRTPQLRAVFFGASEDYAVGENVQFMPYHQLYHGKKGETFDTHSYEGLADAIVNGWVNSPGHYKNMITPDYQVSGLSVVLDTVLKRVYACQNFAQIYNKFRFTENQAFFPYSTYEPPAEVTDFDTTYAQLIPNYAYDYKLKHTHPEKCNECAESVADQPMLTLREDGGYYVLRVENARYLQDIVRDKWDGLAVELVSYQDYACGNPAYYRRPSRRNGELKLNGRILKPLYRDDLMRGYRKRKRIQNVRFFPYFFKHDSVSFFRRFGHYKVDRFSSEYFEIKLGRVPKDLQRLTHHNLVFIQSRQICHIMYFTNYKGELWQEQQKVPFVPPVADGEYTLSPVSHELMFTIPFELGKSTFRKEDIAPFLTSLDDLSYRIDSVRIDAFSSVEGDSVINHRLQQRRAESIAEIIRENHPESVFHITTQTDWNHFYETSRRTVKWNYLSRMSHALLVNELKQLGNDRPESILKEERRARVSLYCTIPVDSANLKYLLKQEHARLYKDLTSPKPTTQAYLGLDSLYAYVYKLVREGKVTPAFLFSLHMPAVYVNYPPLAEKFLFYGAVWPELVAVDPLWREAHGVEEWKLLGTRLDRTPFSQEFLYQCARMKTLRLNEPRCVLGSADLDRFNRLFDLLEPSYNTDSVMRVGIDRMNMNIWTHLVGKQWKDSVEHYARHVERGVGLLYEMYARNGMNDQQHMIKLARIAIHYGLIPWASQMLKEHLDLDTLEVLYMQLGYFHDSYLSPDEHVEYTQKYVERLVELATLMEPRIWCSQFKGDTGIPFQILDYKPLRDVYCRTCVDVPE